MKGTPQLLRPVVVFIAVIGMMFGAMGMASADAVWEGNGVTNGVLDTVICFGDPNADENTPEGAYLHWIFTGGLPASISIYSNGTLVESGDMYVMGAGGGAAHFYSGYYDLSSLAADVTSPNTGNLVISHGCPPPPVNEWCSPGFWKNNSTTWPVSLDTKYNDVFDPDLAGNPTLLYVLQNPKIYGGTTTEMVADYLSGMHPGVDFTGERYNGYDEYGKPIEICPLAGDGNQG